MTKRQQELRERFFQGALDVWLKNFVDGCSLKFHSSVASSEPMLSVEVLHGAERFGTATVASFEQLEKDAHGLGAQAMRDMLTATRESIKKATS